MRFFKSDVEFTTSVNIEECRKRLMAMHAKVWEGKPSFWWSNYQVGFLWYGKPKTFLALSLNGPALLGYLKPSSQGTIVEVNFQPYYKPQDTALLMVVGVLILGIANKWFAHISPWLILISLGVLALVNGMQWIIYSWFRPHWRGLVDRLQEGLLSDTFNALEYEWGDVSDKNYVPVLLLLLAILIPVCLFLEWSRLASR